MSKVLAGGWELDRPVYSDAKPNQDRTPAPDDQVAAFMAKNLFYCQGLAARITARQCQINRGKDLYLCGKCDAEKPVNTAALPTKRAKRSKRDNPDRPWRDNPVFIPQVCRESTFHALEEQNPPLATLSSIDFGTGDHTVISVVEAESGEIISVRSGQVRSGQVRSG